ncbi:MAG: sulfoxide reductase heme-binding subunit YedZ [Caldilineaceae bacterium]|nr:sulfoxide reductase heme-binding subunit YedZ [Caldilineaceae bacterium]
MRTTTSPKRESPTAKVPVLAYVQKQWVWLVANVAGLIPLVLLIQGYTSGQWIDPVAEVTSRTGSAALIMLVASLAVTPVNIVFGWRKIIPARKPLGLYAFFYAALHLLNFIGMDYGFSLQAFLDDALLQKRYMIVGFSAFFILLPLAITSTKGWMKRLGQRWKRLHQLAYVAGILAVLHFLWLVKIDITEPVIYGSILLLLLALRLPRIRKLFTRLHVKPAKQQSTRRPNLTGGKPMAEVTTTVEC